MELLAIPPALLAASLVVKHVFDRRAARSPAPVTPPTFRVVALGGPGSGKTVFLSSLFHSLGYRTPGRGYHLEADAAQRVDLRSLHRAVRDTSQPWPKGTNKGETREFLFDCLAAAGAETPRPVMRMGYLDYAGELIEEQTDDGGTALADLAARIDKADALLGMIDGLKMVRLLRDEPAARSYFEHGLQPMFGFLRNASCPIHLVVTKWDLVRGFGEPADASDEYRLDRVAEALLRYEHIRALVEDHSARQVVRLIPVSAVGADFVDLNTDGMVVKRPHGHLKPTNVEVPFNAVLPDLFRQVEGSLDQELDRGLWKSFARPSGAALR
jgi:hypothetical protein